MEVSAPKKYSKLAHLMRFHSWAPIYCDYDEVTSVSLDYVYSAAAPGLSGYFQNNLSTMSGMLGFAFAPDPSDESTWRPSIHAKFKYSGLYPVIEGSLDFGQTIADLYAKVRVREGEDISYVIAGGSWEKPQISGRIKAYIPLGFSKGGISYGFVPQITYSISNSRFDNAIRNLTVTGRDPETNEPSYEWASGHVPVYVPMQRLTASARGYIVRQRARSQVYPRWGIGLEAGYSVRPGIAPTFRPNAYVYAYGYLPGILRTQGIKLTGTFQQQIVLGESPLQLGELVANTLPRGFFQTAKNKAGSLYPWQLNASAAYAIPVFVGDIALPPIMYVRNFLITPTADFTLLPGSDNLWSVGADITAQFGKFIIPFDGALGVSVSYLGGNAYQKVGQPSHWSVQLIMSFDFN